MDKQIEIEKSKVNSLKPPSQALVKIYGLLAILLVIIPEWLAEVTLGIENKSHITGLAEKDTIWNTNPELKLSIMSIKEMRELAKQLKIQGYSRESRDYLKKRILKRINRQSIALEKLIQKILRIK